MKLEASKLTRLSVDELDELFSAIDHRSSEDEVISEIQEQTTNAFSYEWKTTTDSDDELWVTFEGTKCHIPLTGTRHDRYVAISSMAEILKNRYIFWLDPSSLESDTHGLLITTSDCATELEAEHSYWVQQHLFKLVIGVDYFGDMKVPYYGHPNNNPRFEEEAAELDDKISEMEDRISMSNPEFARLLSEDPEAQAALGKINSIYRKVQIIRAGKYVAYALIIAWLVYRFVIHR